MPCVPTRLMYSRDDGLIPHESIHAFKEDLAGRYAAQGHCTYTATTAPIEGAAGEEVELPMVSEKVFQGVGHTAPFLDKSTREEYRRDLVQFLELPEPVKV